MYILPAKIQGKKWKNLPLLYFTGVARFFYIQRTNFVRNSTHTHTKKNTFHIWILTLDTYNKIKNKHHQHWKLDNFFRQTLCFQWHNNNNNKKREKSKIFFSRLDKKSFDDHRIWWWIHDDDYFIICRGK